MPRSGRELLAVGLVGVLWLTAMCAADEREKCDGPKVGDVQAVIVDGERRVISASGQAGTAQAQGKQASGEPSRTDAEIAQMIAEAGTTKPAWWDQEPLNLPPTLDITWNTTGWKPDENIGTHLFIVCPRPEKWKYAVKLLDRAVSQLDQRNTQRRVECMILMGDFYSRLEDWPRAAYWWQTAGVSGSGDQPYGLVRCYWKLGNKPLAMPLLSQVTTDGHRYAQAIRLWSEMGELDKALALSEASARVHPPDPIYLAAGDACRRAGDYEKAEQYYDKVVALSRGSMQLDANKSRAGASLAAVRGLKLLDLTVLGDGQYQGSSRGFRGDVEVQLTLKQGRIESVRVTREGEDREFDAMSSIPRQVVEKQGIAGVDAVTGATVSSEAVLNAAAKALAAAKK
jgi:uncharacterized protein with FMN-binding domain